MFSLLTLIDTKTALTSVMSFLDDFTHTEWNIDDYNVSTTAMVIMMVMMVKIHNSSSNNDNDDDDDDCIINDMFCVAHSVFRSMRLLYGFS